MFCFADATGEMLAGGLRPGNDGANTVADHSWPSTRPSPNCQNDRRRPPTAGDPDARWTRSVIVRADSAGCTEGFFSACRERTSPSSSRHARIPRSPAPSSMPSARHGLGAGRRPGRHARDGASVCELTSLIDDQKLPAATRLIVRREPLHPGAQRSLFPSLEFRYWGFYTDAEGTPFELDATMRAHAHVEQHIQRLKDSGLSRFPFTSFEANANWM